MPDIKQITHELELVMLEANPWKECPPVSCDVSYSLLCDVLSLLKAQPEIVRCKDCTHRDPEDKKCDCGHTIQWQLPRPDDWFCADGERKEGEQDGQTV